MAVGNVLVLQTLMASNALSALRFLTDSAAPALVAEGLSGILAQTLVRRVCTSCREYYEVPAFDLRRFGYKATDPDESVLLARGKGCGQCRNTGYKGRIGLFELTLMNEEIAEAVASRAPQTQLKQILRRTNPLTLREDGVNKILQGLTTPDEILRVVPMLST